MKRRGYYASFRRHKDKKIYLSQFDKWLFNIYSGIPTTSISTITPSLKYIQEDYFQHPSSSGLSQREKQKIPTIH